MRLSAQAGAKAPGPGTYRPVPLDSIAPAMAEAAVTAEDARFWVHSGIDWYEVRHALDVGDNVPLVLCDARDRESCKTVLARVIEHAMSKLDHAVA